MDERERDRDVWLDPLTRGSALHDIYAALGRRCRDAGRRPDVKKDGPWLRELALKTLDQLHLEMPAATWVKERVRRRRARVQAATLTPLARPGGE